MFGDRFYSVQSVADALDYHQDSIYRAIHRGELAASKPKGKWLISGEAINAWLAAASAPPARADAAPAPARGRSAVGSRRSSSGARGSFRERARRARAAGT